MSGKIKLLVCDDHRLFRKGVIAVFRDDPTVQVVGHARDGREAIQRIKQVHPDVVLMDISMPGMNGVEATQRIARSSTAPKVLILTMYNEDDLIMRCLEAGASGYILKDAPSAQLIDAVKRAFKGGRYFSPGISSDLVNEYLQKPVRQKDTSAELGGKHSGRRAA